MVLQSTFGDVASYRMSFECVSHLSVYGKFKSVREICKRAELADNMERTHRYFEGEVACACSFVDTLNRFCFDFI